MRLSVCLSATTLAFVSACIYGIVLGLNFEGTQSKGHAAFIGRGRLIHIMSSKKPPTT